MPQRQRLQPVRGQIHRAAQLFKLILENQLADGVVFDHQYMQAQRFVDTGARPDRPRIGAQPLSLTDRATQVLQVAQVDVPLRCFLLGRGKADIAAGHDHRPRPVRRQVLLVFAGVQFNQHRAAVADVHARPQHLRPRAPAAQPATDVLGHFLHRRHHKHRFWQQLDQCTHGRRVALLKGQAQGKAAAEPRLADHPHAAAHQVRQALTNRQAQPGAGNHIGAVAGLVKRVEQERLVLLRDPLPGVCDLPQHGDALVDPALHVDPHHDLPAFGEFDRVAQQVVEDLPDPRAISDQLIGQVRVDVCVQL